jgi:hypothetical protein
LIIIGAALAIIIAHLLLAIGWRYFLFDSADLRSVAKKDLLRLSRAAWIAGIHIVG